MTKCIHFWVINSDNFGFCKKCGAEKQFPIERFPRFNDSERSNIESFGAIGGNDTASVPFGFHVMDMEMLWRQM